MELIINTETYHCPDVGDIATLRLSGPVDQQSVQVFESTVLELYRRGICRIILDLSDTKYLNSTGLGLLINIAHKVNVVGGGIRLINVAEKFKVLFDMLGLDTCLPILAGYGEAVTSFGGRVEEMVPINGDVSNSDALVEKSDVEEENNEEEQYQPTFEGLLINTKILQEAENCDTQIEENKEVEEPEQAEEAPEEESEPGNFTFEGFLLETEIKENEAINDEETKEKEDIKEELKEILEEPETATLYQESAKTPLLRKTLAKKLHDQQLQILPKTPSQSRLLFAPENITHVQPESTNVEVDDARVSTNVEVISSEHTPKVEEPQLPSSDKVEQESPTKRIILEEQAVVPTNLPTSSTSQAEPLLKIPERKSEQVWRSIKRKAMVRYYNKMNSYKTYPMSVILEDITKSKNINELSPITLHNSIVIVIPRFPGCQVKPEQIAMDISSSKAVSEFWLTPFSKGSPQGHIPGWIEVWYEKKIQEHFATPFRIVNSILTVIAIGCTFFFALLGVVMDYLQPNVDMLLLLSNLLQKVGGWRPLGVIGGLFCLILSVSFFLKFHDREANPLEKISNLKMR